MNDSGIDAHRTGSADTDAQDFRPVDAGFLEGYPDETAHRSEGRFRVRRLFKGEDAGEDHPGGEILDGDRRRTDPEIHAHGEGGIGYHTIIEGSAAFTVARAPFRMQIGGDEPRSFEFGEDPEDGGRLQARDARGDALGHRSVPEDEPQDELFVPFPDRRGPERSGCSACHRLSLPVCARGGTDRPKAPPAVRER